MSSFSIFALSDLSDVLRILLRTKVRRGDPPNESARGQEGRSCIIPITYKSHSRRNLEWLQGRR